MSKEGTPPETFAKTVWIMSATMSTVTGAPASTTTGVVKKVCALSTVPVPPGPGTTKEANCGPPTGGEVVIPFGEAGSV